MDCNVLLKFIFGVAGQPTIDCHIRYLGGFNFFSWKPQQIFESFQHISTLYKKLSHTTLIIFGFHSASPPNYLKWNSPYLHENEIVENDKMKKVNHG